MTLSPQVFAIIAQLVEERVGLHYSLGDIELLGEKLSERAAELGLGSLLDYYYFLRYDQGGTDELRILVESLVVQETYFFRENDAVRVLVDTLLPEMLEHRPSVRLWSAACATGEEPYSIALLLAQRGLLPRVEIVASDLSARALERARAGIYGARSFRRKPEDARFISMFDEVPAGRRLDGSIRRRIDWRRVNLLDAAEIAALGTFDAIVCRNVLIYFADATVACVAEHLGSALRPGGALLVGASESLLRFGTLFSCEERGGAFFYRKPGP